MTTLDRSANLACAVDEDNNNVETTTTDAAHPHNTAAADVLDSTFMIGGTRGYRWLCPEAGASVVSINKLQNLLRNDRRKVELRWLASL